MIIFDFKFGLHVIEYCKVKFGSEKRAYGI